MTTVTCLVIKKLGSGVHNKAINLRTACGVWSHQLRGYVATELVIISPCK